MHTQLSTSQAVTKLWVSNTRTHDRMLYVIHLSKCCHLEGYLLEGYPELINEFKQWQTVRDLLFTLLYLHIHTHLIDVPEVTVWRALFLSHTPAVWCVLECQCKSSNILSICSIRQCSNSLDCSIHLLLVSTVTFKRVEEETQEGREDHLQCGVSLSYNCHPNNQPDGCSRLCKSCYILIV